jgi:Holliday junction resolvase
MPSPSKAKGNRFERLCVNIAKGLGFSSKRAWGSDGRSLGEHPEVDVIIGGYKAQCKTRKRIAKWIKPSKEVDIQLVKENHGETYVIQKYENWLNMILKK